MALGSIFKTYAVMNVGSSLLSMVGIDTSKFNVGSLLSDFKENFLDYKVEGNGIIGSAWKSLSSTVSERFGMLTGCISDAAYNIDSAAEFANKEYVDSKNQAKQDENVEQSAEQMSEHGNKEAVSNAEVSGEQTASNAKIEEQVRRAKAIAPDEQISQDEDQKGA